MKIMQLRDTCEFAADAFPTGEHASSPKDVIRDAIHVS